MTPQQNEFFTNLYMQHFNRIKLYIQGKIHDKEGARDIAQDTFREVLRRIDDAMDHEKPEAWLTETAKNKILEYLRYRSRHLSWLLSLEEIPEHLAAGEEKGFQWLDNGYSELAKILRDTLDDDDLYLLRRTIIEKAGYLTVAKELGVSLSTIEKRVAKIRKKLEPHFPEYKKKK